MTLVFIIIGVFDWEKPLSPPWLSLIVVAITRFFWFPVPFTSFLSSLATAKKKILLFCCDAFLFVVEPLPLRLGGCHAGD